MINIENIPQVGDIFLTPEIVHESRPAVPIYYSRVVEVDLDGGWVWHIEIDIDGQDVVAVASGRDISYFA